MSKSIISVTKSRDCVPSDLLEEVEGFFFCSECGYVKIETSENGTIIIHNDPEDKEVWN